jgi:BirA family biotin operon repressor/biotin-[acetyl-CoA-carboxylase] ligase
LRPDPLPADLARALTDASTRLGPFGRVEYFADVDSTNTRALERATRGAPHGLVVIAEAQRAGRGRQGRAWFSPAGAGLYMSVLLRERAWAGALSLVTLAAGVATARGLSAATGLAPELKWPNDVVIGRPWRKIAGILAESVTAGARIDAVVVGIGVNLRKSAFPTEIADRATAVEMETDRVVEGTACVVEILAALARVTSDLSAGRGADVVRAFRALSATGLGGAPVRWTDATGPRRGVARDIDDTGALLVDSEGRRERLFSGEVQWERLSRD